MQIKFKKLNRNAKAPVRATSGSAGYDLYACDPTIVDRFGTPIRTGIAVEIPEGHVGLVLPRSGLAFSNGVLSYIGVIDSDYRGEVKVLMYLLPSEPGEVYVVNPGDRVAQLVVVQIPLINGYMEVLELSDTDRGDGGFGSTGR